MRKKLKKVNRIKPDYQYESETVSKFINYVMKDGKKNVARTIMYGAMEEVAQKTKKDALEIFETAIRNVSPSIEVRSRRVGGANYQVPREVRPERQLALSFRWILDAARSKKGVPMHKKLADEIINASKNEGVAVKKRESVHKMAEANKAFAHFAW